MDAFNDILTAEKEAELAVNTAKQEVEAAIIAAKSEHKARLEAESIKLTEAENSALATHQKHISTLTGKIESEINTKIVQVEKHFSDNLSALKTVVKQGLN